MMTGGCCSFTFPLSLKVVLKPFSKAEGALLLFHLLFALLCCLLTWNCVSRIFRVAPEAGAAEDLHTSNPGRTFKTSQDQTPAPLAPLLTSTGGVCISMCAAPTAALLVELLVICYVFTRVLCLSALVSSLKQFKVSKN